MKELERETFGEAFYDIFMFSMLWFMVCGVISLIAGILLPLIFNITNENFTNFDLAFIIFNWSYGVGEASFILFIIIVYIKGLFKLSKYKKQAVIYNEEKELKDFISHCKAKKA